MRGEGDNLLKKEYTDSFPFIRSGNIIVSPLPPPPFIILLSSSLSISIHRRALMISSCMSHEVFTYLGMESRRKVLCNTFHSENIPSLP